MLHLLLVASVKQSKFDLQPTLALSVTSPTVNLLLALPWLNYNPAVSP